jgi:hypothetical protein
MDDTVMDLVTAGACWWAIAVMAAPGAFTVNIGDTFVTARWLLGAMAGCGAYHWWDQIGAWPSRRWRGGSTLANSVPSTRCFQFDCAGVTTSRRLTILGTTFRLLCDVDVHVKADCTGLSNSAGSNVQAKQFRLCQIELEILGYAL